MNKGYDIADRLKSVKWYKLKLAIGFEASDWRRDVAWHNETVQVRWHIQSDIFYAERSIDRDHLRLLHKHFWMLDSQRRMQK